MADTFPRQYARTQRLTLGEPRDVKVSSDGRRAVFLRSRGGADPVNCLWVVDIESGDERLVADPLELLAEAGKPDGRDHLDDELPPEERARRERLREGASGITSYATDAAGTVAAFALAGRLFVAGLLSGRARPLEVAGPVFDPRPDPPARRLAYVSGRLLCIAELDGSWRVIAGGDLDEPDTVSWGSADFVAAEEMHRYRGYWWSPDGEHLAVCRVDTAPVQRWYLSDPAEPATPEREIAYPAAGTDNADVSLHLFPVAGGEPVDVEWDRATRPYLADVSWTGAGLVVTVQSRDQRSLDVLRVDPADGSTTPLFSDRDNAWVELVPGAPRLRSDGTLVVCADREGARRLLVGGEAVTPPELQVRSIVHVGRGDVVFTANPVDDATVLHVWRYHDPATGDPAADEPAAGDSAADTTAADATSGSGSPADRLRRLSDGDGVHGAAVGGDVVLLRSATIDEPGARWTLPSGTVIERHAERPLVAPSPTLLSGSRRRLATAVLLPADHDGSELPVLLDPYGGPHAQRVLRAHNAYLSSQWFADQGFAVVIADGSGTPGRGSAFEREVHLDLATTVLDDQIEALEHAASEIDALDLDRVAIRGWSFGGYLAALAVLRRPDVFHAAVAGAPVTEWRLYDTHYTERYLGHPAEHADAYDASSLLTIAGELTRPLLLIHGLADDNVVAAHTLQLSSALLAAGAPHEVLPLVGVSHMTPQEVVAEHLLLHQLDFLRRSLGVR